MKYLLIILFVLSAAISARPQGPAGGGIPGPQPVPIQFVDSAPTSCPENRLIVIRSTGVIYKRISGACTIILNGAVVFPTIAQGDILYGSAANTISALAKNTTATRYLSNTGTNNNPAWAQVALATGVSGDLPFANLTQCGALTVTGVAGNATADIACISAGTDNQVLRRSGTALAFGAVNLASSNAVTGALPAANGGTGQSTYTKGDLLVTPGSTTLNKLGVGTDGQVLTADAASTNGVKWAAGGVTGSGTTDTLSIWTSSTELGDGPITYAANLLTATASGGIVLDSGAGIANIGDVNNANNGGRLKIDGGASSRFRFFPDASSNTRYLELALVGLTTNRTATFPDATGTVALVGANLGTVLGLPVNNTALATATGTVYSSPGNAGTPLSTTTEATVSFPAPRAGTLASLFVRTGTTAKVNTPTTVITIRVNGVDTAITVTMTQTTSTTTSDTTHTATVAQGDLITVSLATTGAAAVSTSIAGISFVLN